jgi:hypothetical protein
MLNFPIRQVKGRLVQCFRCFRDNNDDDLIETRSLLLPSFQLAAKHFWLVPQLNSWQAFMISKATTTPKIVARYLRHKVKKLCAAPANSTVICRRYFLIPQIRPTTNRFRTPPAKLSAKTQLPAWFLANHIFQFSKEHYFCSHIYRRKDLEVGVCGRSALPRPLAASSRIPT